jgi:hypothetical protein
MSGREQEPDDDEQHRMTANLAAIIVALIVVIGGFWLIVNLRDAVKNEECLMFGLRKCAKIETR